MTDSTITDKELHLEHEEDNRMWGFSIILLSVSVIFLCFFAGYLVYKTTAVNWLPPGVSGLEIRDPAFNTIILVSSSFVIYIAERFLHKENIWG
ncbi:MAG: heme-copper oxidase subunit III, partial [Pleurocapsa sp.]